LNSSPESAICLPEIRPSPLSDLSEIAPLQERSQVAGSRTFSPATFHFRQYCAGESKARLRLAFPRRPQFRIALRFGELADPIARNGVVDNECAVQLDWSRHRIEAVDRRPDIADFELPAIAAQKFHCAARPQMTASCWSARRHALPRCASDPPSRGSANAAPRRLERRSSKVSLREYSLERLGVRGARNTLTPVSHDLDQGSMLGLFGNLASLPRIEIDLSADRLLYAIA